MGAGQQAESWSARGRVRGVFWLQIRQTDRGRAVIYVVIPVHIKPLHLITVDPMWF